MSYGGRKISCLTQSAVTAAKLRGALLSTTALLASLAATGAAAQEEQATRVDEVLVVGTQIRGAKVTAALPVTVIGEEEISNTAATTGDELFRSVPQMGDVVFNPAYTPGSSNSARGDVGSVNLRNLGTGNTLILLNGRRVVGHPTSQANEFNVPVLTYNTNAIPVAGLRRLEVLRDGAAAIYGTDAVAGVVNTVLRDNMNDWTVSTQYGEAEGTGLREFNLNLAGGRDIADGRGNVSVFASYDNRNGIMSTDQDFTRSSDLRGLFADTPFANVAGLDGRGTTTPWGLFQTVRPGVVSRSGVAVTNASGQFHVQPDAFATCKTGLGAGLCLDSGTLATNGVERNLRYDSAAAGVSIIPDVERVNIFVTGRYDLSDRLTAFGEVGAYYAKSEAMQSPIGTLGSIVVTVPKENYYNPFGPVRFANGDLNSHRLSNLSGVPDEGLDLTLRGYLFSDLGPTKVEVTNKQFRLLGGLRGEIANWNWETALVHSGATAEDVSDNISITALARSLALSTPDAYNLFSGGNLQNYSVGASGRNSQATIDAIREPLHRRTETKLTMWDLRLSRPDLIRLPGGDLGVATGVEVRRETQVDDRDDRIDGTITYTDRSGAVYGDFINSSMNPDNRGERDVFGTYVEFAVPLVSPEMEIPFVHRLEAQIAGRYEHYSDFGDVAKPKVALAWDIVDGFRIRSSWAQGFRAPNLEQVNATIVTRSNGRTDWAYCQALVTTGAIPNFQACSQSYTMAERRSGNPDLKPEESETLSFGTVIQPRFLPETYGDLTVTLDWWRVEQEGMVGLYGGQNALIRDYQLRNAGSFNPNVVRDAPTAEEIALFKAAGLAPAGRVQHIQDQYSNQLPQSVEGLDLGVMWNLRGTRYGDFNLNLNVAHLLKFYLQPTPAVQEMLDAQARGEIDAAIAFIDAGIGDMRRRDAKPEWKWSLSGVWSNGPWAVGAYTSYIGSVDSYATALRNAQDQWVVDAQLTGNLYGEYEIQEGFAGGTRLRLGVRNITNEAPPRAAGGYNGFLHLPYGRYWYVGMRKTF